MSLEARGELDQDGERRRYYRLSPEADVACSIEGMEVVHLVGLGAGGTGMRAITNHELPADRAFDVTLATGSGPDLTLRGRTVWKKAWDFDFCSRHVSGVEFLDLTDEQRQRLVALLPPPDERAEAEDPSTSR